MGWAALIPAGISLVGSMLSNNANKAAAQASADAQVKAAEIAADAARFRPVGTTTRFGTSTFGFDPQGNLSSAGYQLDPQMAALRDRLLSQAGAQGLDAAAMAGQAGTGLFGLGQQYLATSPQQAAEEWMRSQQALLAPGNEQALAGIRNKLFQGGRTGLAMGATEAGGLAATNPEMAAYFNALSRQNQQLAADAQAQGRAATTYGTGLLGSGLDLMSQGYNPFKTQFGLGQSLETAGQGALDIGSQLGGRAAAAGGNVAQSLFAGGTNAAKALQEANKYSPYGAAITGLGQNADAMKALQDYLSSSNTEVPAPPNQWANWNPATQGNVL